MIRFYNPNRIVLDYETAGECPQRRIIYSLDKTNDALNAVFLDYMLHKISEQECVDAMGFIMSVWHDMRPKRREPLMAWVIRRLMRFTSWLTGKTESVSVLDEWEREAVECSLGRDGKK